MANDKCSANRRTRLIAKDSSCDHNDPLEENKANREARCSVAVKGACLGNLGRVRRGASRAIRPDDLEPTFWSICQGHRSTIELQGYTGIRLGTQDLLKDGKCFCTKMYRIRFHGKARSYPNKSDPTTKSSPQAISLIGLYQHPATLAYFALETGQHVRVVLERSQLFGPLL
jgi:hypothetical protein